MTLLTSLITQAYTRFSRNGVDSPRLTAELLAAKTLGCSRLDIIIHQDREVRESQSAQFFTLCHRRELGEPLAYILGEKEFYGQRFHVDPAVLIPRPETERLVDLALERVPPDTEVLMADIGTGSGALAITLLKERPLSTCIAVDISREALAVAARNARLHNVERRVQFVQADLGTPLGLQCFDLVVSNPPYLSPEELKETCREVQQFEPVHALVSGKNGLDALDQLEQQARRTLNKGGTLLMEFGWRQGGDIRRLFSRSDVWTKVDVKKDLAGHDRVVQATVR